MLTQLKELSKAEKEAKVLRENIKAFMDSANIKRGIGTKHNAILMKSAGREKVSIETLKAQFPEVANVVIGEGEGSVRLKIV